MNNSSETPGLRPGERLDDLQRDGLFIIQNPSWFCFGMDAVLLSTFAKTGENMNCMDLATGNGVIPILMSSKWNGGHYTGLELQEDVADMAKRSVVYNGLEDRVHIVQGDLCNAAEQFGKAQFDVVTCNPPYLTKGHGLINEADHKTIARHEMFCTLEDVVSQAAALLKPNGHFYMVHRPFRLAEVIHKMVGYRLEPKRMRLVHPYVDKEPNMVLIEGVKGGNARIQVEPPLIVYEKDQSYTKQLLQWYEEE